MASTISGPDHELIASIVATPLTAPIPAEILESALSKAPFITLPGSFNVRDVGLYATAYVKPGIILRSGMLDHIPEASWPVLRDQLGLAKIYDFRRSDEVKVARCAVEGIEVISCPYKDGDNAAPEFLAAVFAIHDDATVDKAYQDLYEVILKGHTTGYRQVFENLKTVKPGEAVLFHCTAGKDRTGIMAALILDLMGAPAEHIADEYALTRIGMEPLREKLLPSVIDSYGKRTGGGKEGEDLAPLTHLLGSYKKVMLAFLNNLKEEYGGAVGYMKNHLGFSDADIEEIRNNLRPSA